MVFDIFHTIPKPFNKSIGGEINANFWSGFPKVQLQPDDKTEIFPAKSGKEESDVVQACSDNS
jgi:hypothetical protein